MVDHHQRSRHPPCYHLWSGSTELWTLSANVSSIISTVHMRAAAPYGHTWAVKKYTKLTKVLHLSKQLRRSGRTYSVVLEDLRNRRGKTARDRIKSCPPIPSWHISYGQGHTIRPQHKTKEYSLGLGRCGLDRRHWT